MEELQLKIMPNKIIQEHYLGVNALYHGFMFIPDVRKRNYTEEQAQQELSRIEKTNVKIVRTYYNYDFAWYLGRWDWESPAMQGFYRWLDEMKKRGIQVALNAAWNCPGDINSTHNWPWAVSPFTVQGDWRKSVDNYTEWLSESLHQMIEVRGYDNVAYLHMFTEPQRPAGRLLHMDMSGQFNAWLDLVRSAHERLMLDGRRQYVKFVGPNEGSTKTSVMLQWAAQNASEFIDIFSSHNYDYEVDGQDKYDQWYEWAKLGVDYAKQAGKPFWYDEYGAVSNDYRWKNGLYGTQLATANIAFMNAGAQCSLLWTLLDQQWPNNHTNNPDAFFDGIHRWGTAPSLLQSDVPYPSFYAVTLLSRFLNCENAQTIYTEGGEHIHIAAVKIGENDNTIVITNEGDADAKISISSGVPLCKKFYKYVYHPERVQPSNTAKMIACSGSAAVQNTLTDVIEKKSILLYTTLNESGTEGFS